MVNIFENLKKYATKWAEKESRNFTTEEISCVKRTEVVNSQYGLSVCFFFNDGGQSYVPLSSDSKYTLGSSIDMKTAEVVTLSKDGEDDIQRIR